METAAVITNDHSQSVVLPDGIRFEGTEVYVRRVGRSVLLVPKGVDPWDIMAESLGQFTDDYLADRNQPPEQVREAAFE